MWVQHSGGLPGFSTNLCFPKERVGALALLNGIGEAEVLAMDLAGIGRTAVRESAPVIAPPAAMPESYRSLLGIYIGPQSGELIGWSGATRSSCSSRQTIPCGGRPALTATDDPDVFTVDPGFRPSGEPTTFARTNDGRVRSVFLGGETWTRLDPVSG